VGRLIFNEFIEHYCLQVLQSLFMGGSLDGGKMVRSRGFLECRFFIVLLVVFGPVV
jgi:hypothetical protein